MRRGKESERERFRGPEGNSGRQSLTDSLYLYLHIVGSRSRSSRSLCPCHIQVHIYIYTFIYIYRNLCIIPCHHGASRLISSYLALPEESWYTVHAPTATEVLRRRCSSRWLSWICCGQVKKTRHAAPVRGFSMWSLSNKSSTDP